MSFAGYTDDQQQAPQQPQGSPYAGGMFGLGPLGWKQKTALLLSGLGDAFNSARRQPSEYLQNNLGMLQMQRQFAARAGLAQALSSGDPEQARNAKAMALAMGMDITPFQPKYVDVKPYGSELSIDPLTGKATTIASGQARPRQGYHFVTTPDGTTTEQYDKGGPADPDVIQQQSHGRAEGAGRVGFKPSVPKGSNAPAIVPPWQVFGGK